jgi:hypothetical protein
VSYRDDLDAAIMRAESLTRDHAHLTEANEQLQRELAEAKIWLGGKRKRALVLIGFGTLCVVTAIGGIAVGRSTIDCPVVVRAPEMALPQVFGTIVSDGPQFGRWTLNATRCVPRGDGVELAAVGSEDHAIWLTADSADVEVPAGDFVLKHIQCYRGLAHELVRHDGTPPTFDGFVDVDCAFDGNRLQGRIELHGCR